uniref:Retropepsin-like aspartic endopeptidase domain-containing protein n=1 Tax=uncultured marine group II/III euryarchaeote KM3_72_H01 TaxID=1456499 RepID=A0A075HLH5_9EURY|nr:hypothetical protein conserved in archaea [uncultured marine group II/III euryarchaeote KM3_72_H01]
MLSGRSERLELLSGFHSAVMASHEQNPVVEPLTSKTPSGRGRTEGNSMHELVMIGWREWVGIPELEGEPLLAKMDTGAWSNTLHASDIEVIESDLETQVRFRLSEDGEWVDRPLSDWRRVRDTGGHETMRPVIRTTLEIAGMDYDIEVCLKDRSLMRHRFILGRKFLREHFCIHPGRQCIHPNERTLPRIVLQI